MDVLTIIVKTTLNSGIVLAYHQGSAHTGRQQPALNFFYQHPNMPPPLMEKRATTQNFLAEPCITLTIGLSYTYRGYYHCHLVPVCFIHYIMPPAPYTGQKVEFPTVGY